MSYDEFRHACNNNELNKVILNYKEEYIPYRNHAILRNVCAEGHIEILQWLLINSYSVVPIGREVIIEGFKICCAHGNTVNMQIFIGYFRMTESEIKASKGINSALRNLKPTVARWLIRSFKWSVEDLQDVFYELIWMEILNTEEIIELYHKHPNFGKIIYDVLMRAIGEDFTFTLHILKTYGANGNVRELFKKACISGLEYAKVFYPLTKIHSFGELNITEREFSKLCRCKEDIKWYARTFPDFVRATKPFIEATLPEIANRIIYLTKYVFKLYNITVEKYRALIIKILEENEECFEWIWEKFNMSQFRSEIIESKIFRNVCLNNNVQLAQYIHDHLQITDEEFRAMDYGFSESSENLYTSEILHECYTQNFKDIANWIIETFHFDNAEAILHISEEEYSSDY